MASDKEVPNLFVSVYEAAVVLRALDTLKASLKRRLSVETNPVIKQAVADDAYAVEVLSRKFQS